MAKNLKIFFAVDIHGSTMCFKKFVKALEVYGADVGVLGGDLSGKFVVPIVMKEDGTYVYKYLGEKVETKDRSVFEEIEKRLESMGNYYIYINESEFKELLAEGKTLEGRIDEKAKGITLSSGRVEEIFENAVVQRLNEWLEYANERLKKMNKRLYIVPGNDDLPVVDEVIQKHESDYIIFADRRVVEINDHEMAGLSWSNPTPWDTPRETDEENLAKMIEELVSQIKDLEKAIFQFHVPPYGTFLDEAPKLSEDLRPSVSEVISAGSKAVLEAIKKYQPLLGLHGHIHESRAVQKIGKTYVINPGSEYTEGILKGVLVIIDKKKFKNYLFTSG